MSYGAGNWRSGNRIPTEVLLLLRNVVVRIDSDRCTLYSLQKQKIVVGEGFGTQYILENACRESLQTT